MKIVPILLTVLKFKGIINPHSNIRRLLIDSRHNRAGIAVKARFRAVIAYFADHVPRNLRNIDMAIG